MPKSNTLELPHDFASELVDGLNGLTEQWVATEEVMASGHSRDDILTFLCDSPEEAQASATRYTTIRDSILIQLQRVE